jgi:hypothetical protein
MATTTAPAAPSTQDKTAPVTAPSSELAAARTRVAPLLEQFEVSHGRSLTLTGAAVERAATAVRVVAALQRNRR